jgi:hypothetical protein
LAVESDAVFKANPKALEVLKHNLEQRAGNLPK